MLDHDAPEGTPRQRTLLVWCFGPVAGLGADHVRVEGGTRRSVGVEWAHPANDLPANEPDAGEAELRALVEGLDGADRVLVVRTNSTGDSSTYTLRLAAAPDTDDPPAGFDRILALHPFSFKIDCPSDFDCVPVHECDPAPPTAPPIDRLAKDYAGFRRLMLDRLATTVPDWTERNAADLGVTLVEVLAYAADHLSYQQDAVATEAYLGTARHRVSLRRHARLLDHLVHEGCNARAFVALDVESGPEGVALDPVDAAGRRTLLLTRCSRATTLDPDTWEDDPGTAAAEVFEPMHGVRLYEAHNRIPIHTFGDRSCCLPRGATSAALRDHPDRLHLMPGDLLAFEEVKGPARGREAEADPTHRHVVRLVEVRPSAKVVGPNGERAVDDPPLYDDVTGEPYVEVRWEDADALPFPLCVSTVVGDVPVDEVSVARGNVVLVDHGHTHGDVALDPPEVPDGGRYRPTLPGRTVTRCENGGRGAPATAAASDLVRQDPRAALPALELHGEETWRPQPDLLSSSPEAPHFVAETDDERRVTLRFGDGVYGRRPEPGTTLRATFRVGNGRAGNVGAEAISHVVTAVPGIKRVRNPLPAVGGTDPESAERIRTDTPEAFRRQERAVTEADYEEVAIRHPGVANAVATLGWTGSWPTVFISVDRPGGAPVDERFEAELEAWFDQYRMAGYDVEIEPPKEVPLDIVMTVCVDPEHARSDVMRALEAAFSDRDLPDGRRGFFHPDRLSFGDHVYMSRIVARAMEVPGVRHVDAMEGPASPNRFRRWGDVSHDEDREGRIRIGRREIARASNDRDAPELGRIAFQLEGGL